ncbi:MAG: hypothetical protein IJT41_05300 [Clostridia bacterium]|nr:hypothetical protein [Clostridia bacterium]
MRPILMQDETAVGIQEEAVSSAVTDERGGAVVLFYRSSRFSWNDVFSR